MASAPPNRGPARSITTYGPNLGLLTGLHHLVVAALPENSPLAAAAAGGYNNASAETKLEIEAKMVKDISTVIGQRKRLSRSTRLRNEEIVSRIEGRPFSESAKVLETVLLRNVEVIVKRGRRDGNDGPITPAELTQFLVNDVNGNLATDVYDSIQDNRALFSSVDANFRKFYGDDAAENEVAP